MIVVTVALMALLSEVSGTTALAGRGGRSKVVVSSRAGVGHWIGPRHGRTVVIGPRHRRLGRWGHPYPRPVIVPRPSTRQIVINPVPTVRINVPTIQVQPTTLTLWVTNSNGSRIAVELVKDGPWYVGPRGECYTSIPSNEQLRIVYGF